MEVKVIGAGLAGVEAAFYLASKGVKVKLYEMRPKKMTEAHQSGLFAELVCSNSFRSKDPNNAIGLLKNEMVMLKSLVMDVAYQTEVEAGSSLAVDRTSFAEIITNIIKNHKNITVVNKEVKTIDPFVPTIIASGPLTSLALKQELINHFGAVELNFYDAVAPIILASSINKEICYLKSRYDKGKAAYLNCPFSKQEYEEFYQALINAETQPLRTFEVGVFEGCLPIEVMAKRGFDTLRFGPLKPVGLEKEGKRSFAVVQLRQDDASKSMYNLVGFQTNLKFGEQKRIIQMIPGLENAEILRYGVMHKNTYLNSPNILNEFYQTKKYPAIFIAGQISGVEGYIESASSGLACAYHMFEYLNNRKPKPFPKETIIGSLAYYIAAANHKFNPMNANFGLLESLENVKKSERKKAYRARSKKALAYYLEGVK